MKTAIVGSTSAEPGLLKQFKLLCAVIDAPWATRLDHKIARHIIDRYYAKFGNARASLRYLENATGATRTNIIESVRRIVDNRVISVIRQGVGTRPTEYHLNFDFSSKRPSGIVGDTSTSSIADGTSCGAADDTSSRSRGIADRTESYLRNMPTGMLTVSRNNGTPAVPTAPPVSGLEADPAASAVDPKTEPSPFEALWAVFPRKHQRSKAQAAYKALAPTQELHERLIAAAVAWADHYERTNTEKRYCKHMHTWLAEERYLEDLPEPYDNPKEAAIARARENGPRKDSTPLPAGKATGLSPRTPIGRHRVKIVSSEMPDDRTSPEQRLRFSFHIEDGEHQDKEFSHTFKFLSNDENLQAEGQSLFSDLRNATGILDPEDTSDLHGVVVCAIVGKMGRISYAAV